MIFHKGSSSLHFNLCKLQCARFCSQFPAPADRRCNVRDAAGGGMAGLIRLLCHATQHPQRTFRWSSGRAMLYVSKDWEQPRHGFCRAEYNTNSAMSVNEDYTEICHGAGQLRWNAVPPASSGLDA